MAKSLDLIRTQINSIGTKITGLVVVTKLHWPSPHRKRKKIFMISLEKNFNLTIF